MFGLGLRADYDFRVEIAMTSQERRLSAEAKPFAPPTPLAKVVSRDDDEPPRRRGVIVDNLKVSYGFVRLDDDAAAQDLFLDLRVVRRRVEGPLRRRRRRLPLPVVSGADSTVLSHQQEPRSHGGSPPQRAPRPATPVNTMRRRIFRALATGRPGLSPSLEGGLAAHIALLYKLYAPD